MYKQINAQRIDSMLAKEMCTHSVFHSVKGRFIHPLAYDKPISLHCKFYGICYLYKLIFHQLS